MKGHKKQKCVSEQTLELSDGSTYIGTVYDGKPSGRGRLIASPHDVYVGAFLDGKRHGMGKQCAPPGIVYDGEWERDTYHGYGVLRTPESVYSGRFYHGKYHGYGELSSDESYAGEWSHGSKHGPGTLTNSAGTYIGSFYYNLRHGNGVQTSTDGSVYSGSWRSGYKHGTGVHTSLFETYTGSWVNNKRQGHGKWQSNYLGTYVGHWKRNLRHKRGTHTYLDGSVYTGGWSYGKRTGYGVMQYADGAVYSGFWLKDDHNGRGTLKEASGRAFKGQWANGEREGMFEETMHGNVVSEGPWLCDVRHGAFKVGGGRALYLWGVETTFGTVKEARAAVQRLLSQKDALSAEEVIMFYPKLCTWSLFYKYDASGIVLHMLPPELVDAKFRKYAYKLFRAKRYAFVERMFRLCSDALQEQIVDTIDVLFDAMTKEFVANPWVVGDVGYSVATRDKLLEGLHLGEFGRCPPKNPYTRQALTPTSGTFLSELKMAKSVYSKMCKAGPKTIETLAFEYNMQDYEQLLKNAREANDRATITRLMKERNALITRRRSDSHGCQNPSHSQSSA